MKMKLLSIVIALSLGATTVVLAGSSIRIGSAGGQELLIPVGSRGYALGGAVVADASGIEATHWNPAGLSRTTGAEVMFFHMPYIADINMNFFGISSELGSMGTFAATAKILDIGEIEETTEAQPGGTGNFFNPTLSVIGLTFSRQMTHQVNFGITMNYINERIHEVSANSVSFDMGFMFDPRWNGVQVGMVIKNIGPDIRFGGRGFDLRDEDVGERAVRSRNAAAELPSHVVLGASYTPQYDGDHAFTFSGNFQSNNFSEDAWIGGLEYAYDGKYFLRGAYSYSQDVENDAGDVLNPYIYGLSLGAGFTMELNETLMTFEGAWRETEFFDSEAVFSLKLGF
jgi:hypothetical protein